MSAIAPGMILIAYLCGSISSAILVCRLCGLPDPRTSGSGNPGATNVLRIGGKGAAVAVLIFDVLKGMLPVWGAYELGVSPFWLGLIAIAACLGHIWPVFFGFKGGKGVLTCAGIALVVNPLAFLFGFSCFVLIVLLTRYVSLGSIVSITVFAVSVGVINLLTNRPVLLETGLAVLFAAIVIFMHRANIKRLLNGTENKLRFGAKR